MIDYSIDWFIQRNVKTTELQNVKFTGSIGTSPEYGIMYRPIFEYKIEVIVLNDNEEDSHLRGECSVKEYRVSDTEVLYPVQTKELVGLTEENLNEIKTWLDEHFLLCKRDYNITMKNPIMNKRGVFWIIDGELIAFLFDETATEGVAKSGKTYNHRLLWEHIKPCNKPFDYYPRGRVEYNSKGKAIIYMNPCIEDRYMDEIKTAFGITTQPIIRYDLSEHYKCYLDK